MYNQKEREFLEVLHRFHKLKGKMKPKDLSHVDFMILGTIRMHMEKQGNLDTTTQGVTITELTKHLQVTKPFISKTLRGLEERNYVKRIGDQVDKRVTRIQLTSQGSSKLEESHNGMREFISGVLKKMGEEDTNHLFCLLDKLYGIMKEEVTEIEEDK